MDSLHELAKAIQEHIARFQELRPKFEAYIKNKEIPLELRWDLWENAPREMKRENGWASSMRFEAFRLLGIKPEDAIMCEGTIVRADRHQTVKYDWILESTEEYCEDRGISEELRDKVIAALQEEMLESNFYSAVYDW